MFHIDPATTDTVYQSFILLVVLVYSIRLMNGISRDRHKSPESLFFILFILLLMGFRAYDSVNTGRYFGDTITYYYSFNIAASGYESFDFKDPGFNLFTLIFAKYTSARVYFFTLSALYLFPVYYALKRFSHHRTFILVLMFATHFLFWSNGVNGIRIGVATSLFFLAISYENKKWLQMLFLALAVTFHLSIILPVIAYLFTRYYTTNIAYLIGWVSSIFLSLAFGGFWESFFSRFDTNDGRLSTYLTTHSDAYLFAYVGFRWDFLVYSTIPVAFGIFYIYNKNYKDKFYIHVFNTYLVSNAFWILVIRANYSNRFASLSWFLIPVLILLPLVRVRMFKNQSPIIALILICSALFTSFMGIL